MLTPSLGLLVALAALGVLATRTGATTRELPGHPCGLATEPTVAGAVSTVASNIYRREAAGGADKRQVERNVPLLRALASGSRPAVLAAVTHLVYSGTHIVRLRVIRGGAVLADVGGPYVLAPVRGSLRYRGRTVGSYVLSVQDDVGYVKLETRFIGLPLIVERSSGRVPLPGTIPAGAAIPESGTTTFQGGDYRVVSLRGEAVPSGLLRISLLLPAVTADVVHSCATVRVRELGRLAERIWQRFALVHGSSASYIESAVALTGALIYIRAGSRQLAASSPPGPSALPQEGSISYHGVLYGVTSFAAPAAGANARVYVLVAG
jgi:hypothetical protein